MVEFAFGGPGVEVPARGVVVCPAVVRVRSGLPVVVAGCVVVVSPVVDDPEVPASAVGWLQPTTSSARPRVKKNAFFMGPHFALFHKGSEGCSGDVLRKCGSLPAQTVPAG